MTNKRQRCFVIMPFSETKHHTRTYWTSHFEDFLKPLIEENPDLEAYRSQPIRGDILGEIIRHLVVSPVVVADLTDQNPNVYWELGVRQSFKHGTVTIAEAETLLPFDIGGKSTLFYYPKDHLEMANFRKDFKEALQDCLANPNRPDSHVMETLSGRGTLFQIFRRDEAMRRLDAMLAECATNREVLKKCVKRAQLNQKNPGRREVPTLRLLGAAVELLVTNRYVDEPESFFELASDWVIWILALNQNLDCWLYTDDIAEQWLLKNKKAAMKTLEGIQAAVAAVRDRVSKQF